jgi:hypothetical protein
VGFITGNSGYSIKESTGCVRAFRCVTYWTLYFDTRTLRTLNQLAHGELQTPLDAL